MTRSLAKKALLIPILYMLTACGTPESTSDVSARHDVDTQRIAIEDVLNFFDAFDAIRTSDQGRGAMTVEQLLRIVPLDDGQRRQLLKAFPSPIAIACDGELCQASTSGSGAEAVMPITVLGFSNPKLVLGKHVTTRMVRRATGIEFCDVRGMSAKKFFVSIPVQGLFLSLEGRKASLIINTGDDRENFTCR